jgi:hypothetical protein
MQHMKANASPSNVVIQIDFAENYSCEYQDEATAAHWLKSQVSLFTACIWQAPQAPQSYVIASDNLQHEKTTVVANLVTLLKNGLPPNGLRDRVTIFSDGPASQFKNRFVYAIMQNIRKYFGIRQLLWSFFAASHGKGPVDGVGGHAKRQVTQL